MQDGTPKDKDTSFKDGSGDAAESGYSQTRPGLWGLLLN